MFTHRTCDERSEIIQLTSVLQIAYLKMADTNVLQLVLNKIDTLSNDLKKEVNEICIEYKELIKEVVADFNKKLLDLDKRCEEKYYELKKEILKLKSTKPEKEEVVRDKRKNIIISGGKFHLDKEGVSKAVEQFMKNKLGINANIDEITVINQGQKSPKVLVKLLKMEDKKLIMKNKKKLKDLNEFIFIDDDLTKDERDIQKRVREVAKKERKLGKRVKIGLKKLNINGKWININDYKSCS